MADLIRCNRCNKWPAAWQKKDGTPLCDDCSSGELFAHPQFRSVPLTPNRLRREKALAAHAAGDFDVGPVHRARWIATLGEIDNLVCWGVDCVHEAHALDMAAASQAALDTARGKLEEVYAAIRRLRDSTPAHHDIDELVAMLPKEEG